MLLYNMHYAHALNTKDNKMAEKKVIIKSEETKVPAFISNEELKRKAAELEVAKKQSEKQS